MSEKFTPGPWVEAGPSYGKGTMQKVSSIIPESDPDDDIDDICFFPEYIDDELNRANARLIAAAPDMYQTLQHALIDMDAIDKITDLAGVHRFRLLRDEITAALAKADGTP